MKSEFKRVVDAQLSGVEWTNIHTENVLKRLEDEKMTKRISVKTLLIAAVLFVLTAAVAFAVGGSDEHGPHERDGEVRPERRGHRVHGRPL